MLILSLFCKSQTCNSKIVKHSQSCTAASLTHAEPGAHSPSGPLLHGAEGFLEEARHGLLAGGSGELLRRYRGEGRHPRWKEQLE
jgi:hypothetical protein